MSSIAFVLTTTSWLRPLPMSTTRSRSRPHMPMTSRTTSQPTAFMRPSRPRSSAPPPPPPPPALRALLAEFLQHETDIRRSSAITTRAERSGPWWMWPARLIVTASTACAAVIGNVIPKA